MGKKHRNRRMPVVFADTSWDIVRVSGGHNRRYVLVGQGDLSFVTLRVSQRTLNKNEYELRVDEVA